MFTIGCLSLLAAFTALFALGAFRLGSDADDADEELIRQLDYTEWAQLPKDGSRGVLK